MCVAVAEVEHHHALELVAPLVVVVLVLGRREGRADVVAVTAFGGGSPASTGAGTSPSSSWTSPGLARSSSAWPSWWSSRGGLRGCRSRARRGEARYEGRHSFVEVGGGGEQERSEEKEERMS